MKIALGLLLGLAVGAGCRWLDLPVPSPPKLVGALLVVAMTLGYIATDAIIARKFAQRGAATTEHLCGGPTGATTSQKAGQLQASNEKGEAR